VAGGIQDSLGIVEVLSRISLGWSEAHTAVVDQVVKTCQVLDWGQVGSLSFALILCLLLVSGCKLLSSRVDVKAAHLDCLLVTWPQDCVEHSLLLSLVVGLLGSLDLRKVDVLMQVLCQLVFVHQDLLQ